ncbi:enoyl-CoA hydratase/isomerase family protein [Pseudochrobactrum sp. MP213Fo]|uniref:enoyl-CoA hydratase/isomerase family protein n=1 Tax=Pseudochrobactrum sp. MP213Fo TaxID=3022250 RepID=UPI003BA22B53
MTNSYVNLNEDRALPDFGGDDEVQFAAHGALGLIRLTRPKALNALTHKMVLAMERALLHWADDDHIKSVLIEGEGRAFCAGGDVVAAYHAGKNGTPAFAFFKDEYRLNSLMGSYKKPYIAVLDGITMGGGAGISIHGSHRIVTENTLFAMPESGIGFFTDVGASAFLPLLPQKLGLWLGLTGSAIRWGDCLQSGLATHALYAQQIEYLREQLIGGHLPDDILNKNAVMPLAQPDWEMPEAQRSLIARCCGGDTLTHCIAGFDKAAADGDAFAQDTAQVLARRSPTSLCAIFTLIKDAEAFIRANPALSYGARLDRQLKIEYALAEILLRGHDFYAGVGAVLIDKTGNPEWCPATIEQVQEKWEPVFRPNLR